MPKYPINSLHDGMNRYLASEAVPETQLVNAVGVDIYKSGKLAPLQGGKKLTDNISGVVWAEQAWVAGKFTIYYTTSAGLYRLTSFNWNSNGTLISSSITGEFSVAVLNEVGYIASSQARLRDDGTTCTTWGVSAPTMAPTLALVSHYTKTIDNCEATTDWTVTAGTVSTSTICMQGSRSLRFLSGITATTSTDTYSGTHTGPDNSPDLIDSVNFSEQVRVGGTATNVTKVQTAVITGIVTTVIDGDTIEGVLSGGADWDIGDTYSFAQIATGVTAPGSRTVAVKTGTWDLTVFDNGSASNEQDYIELWMYYADIKAISQMVISFDCNDGTFLKDSYYYLISNETSNANITVINPGESIIYPGENIIANPYQNISTKERYKDGSILGYLGPTYTQTPTYNPFIAGLSQASYPYLPLMPTQLLRNPVLESERWARYRIHKSEFVKIGSTENKDWSTIRGIMLLVQSASGYNGDVYLDYVHLRGGGKHSSQYYGMYAYGVCDSSGNTLRTSACSPISALIEADQNKLTWTVANSSESHVNQKILFLNGGTMGDWFVAGKINDNTTLSTETSIADWEYQDIIANYYDTEGGRDVRDVNVPPAITKAANYQNRLIGLGYSGQQKAIYISSRNKGDDFPQLNFVNLSNKGEALKNIVPTNRYLHVRGSIEEHRITFGDINDISTIDNDTIEGEYAAVGARDAAKAMDGSIVGVSANDIVISDGLQSIPVNGGLMDIVSSNDNSSASVVTLGRKVYLSLNTIDGDRVILMDGAQQLKPCYIWDREITCLMANPVTKKLYGVYNGSLYEMLNNYGWQTAVGTAETGTTFRFETAKLQLKDFSSFESVRMDYIGDLTLDIYVDDVLMARHALSSTTRTEDRFGCDMGASGRFIQLKVYGTASSESSPAVYMPIVIYYAPGEDDA